MIGFSANLDPAKEHEAIAAELELLIRGQRLSMLPPLLRSTHKELVSRLTTYRPDIVHFVGHGEAGEVLLTDDAGNPRALNTDMARDLFRALAETGESPALVFLNCCLASEVGKAIAREGPTTVAFQTKLGDAWARRYATSFYEHWLGKGMELNQANQLAMVAAGNLPLGTTKPVVFLGTGPYRGARLEAKPNAGKHAKRRARLAWQAITATFFTCAVILGVTTDMFTLRGCSGFGPKGPGDPPVEEVDKTGATPFAGGGGTEPDKNDKPKTPQDRQEGKDATEQQAIGDSNAAKQERPKSTAEASVATRTILVIPPLNLSGLKDEIDLKVPSQSLTGQPIYVRVSRLTREVQGKMGDAISDLTKALSKRENGKNLKHIDRDRFDQIVGERQRGSGDDPYFEEANTGRFRKLNLADVFVQSEIGQLTINVTRPDRELGTNGNKICRGTMKIRIVDAAEDKSVAEMSFECKGIVARDDSDDNAVKSWLANLKSEMAKSDKLKEALRSLCQ